MSNFFQKLLEDAIGTQRGEALEAKLQPTLTALTPLAQDLIAVAVKNDPQLGNLITNGEAIANAINNLGHGAAAPTVPTSGLTAADITTITNAALTAIGVPSTDDAAFDAAMQAAYDDWKSRQTNPTVAG